ncbi:HNH endonuclease [Peribacillus asahii]|uniref:HNH endonuclease n=1 Tax=Peribacillus asahii TaxID=228899 RepID=UPI00207AFE75|nr:HNH endonuclease [Peribacillus asahii]USK58148.1 HNH endonuclease [Peribacillus asahii]
MITGAADKNVVDHINRDTLDNRRANLRVVTHKENALNRKVQKNNSSGVTNVRIHGLSNKWQAYIRIDNKFISLGLFADKEVAGKVVRDYKSKMAL